ncbi:accessory Sec system translocase SecA2 [Microbacterium ulmi]|uniref:accessory Sec system translocase SecA2 n=1 Tax=Microbacterium ulmi TaxID=179095 RepID=UPI001ABB1C1A|nr:preprotein translocase subunit SecA [Microbacterium ulmi]
MGAKDWLGRAMGLGGAVSFARFAPDAADAASLARLAPLRESAIHALGLTPFDEQLAAVAALLAGHAVELDTGEGKTLVGALAAAAQALGGRRVHVLSVNDYLAQRDAEWMGPLFERLGVSVAWVGQRTARDERRAAYRAQVVYAPVSEVGYDVLRDRFAQDAADRVAPEFDVAIVDEADAVMIDEAMSPLVLAGASDDEGADLAAATALADHLEPGTHYEVDADHATVSLTDAGLDALEARLGGVNLYAAEHAPLLTRINLALHARVLVVRDVDYIVDDGVVRLVDTGRGRVAHLQRWPDGLHAAVEAAEGVSATEPGVVLDQLTVQDLLRQYRTLSGMSGTMVAVAADLAEFYELRTGRIEPHRPRIRVDEPDRVFATSDERRPALIAEVRARHERGQPVLVGTQSVAESEELGDALRAQGLDVQVLNAKNDAHEAEVIARAGEFGAVTISTQLSGRGTDIRLGGADEHDHERVAVAGGLAVLASGRFPSNRLDAQLRGRAGRQGDPGASLAFVSLDDDLVQAHAPAHLLAKIARRGATLTPRERRRIVDSCQRIAEGVRLDRHRSTWAYHRATAHQREAVLRHREEMLTSTDAALDVVRERRPAEVEALETQAGRDAVAATARGIVLHFLDERWQDHLGMLAEVRDGIHLQALAGRNPADEFHRIALREFEGVVDGAFADAADVVSRLGPDDVGRDLADLGLRRPSATWTYMMSDNPLGSPGDRLARGLGRQMRQRVYRIE